MATYDDVIEANVSTDGVPVGRAGFATCIICDPAAGMTERVQFYSSPAEAATALAAGDITAAQKAAIDAAFGQDSPRPARVGAGRLGADVAQVTTVTIAGTIANADEYTITIDGTDYTYTATVPSDDAAAVAAGLRALISSGGDPVTPSGSGADVVLTADVAGTAFTVAVSTTSSAGTITAVETTANRNISEDLDAIKAASGAWYGFSIVSRVAVQIERAAAWARLNKRFFGGQTSDVAAANNTAGNISATLKAATENSAKLFWYSNDSQHFTFALMCSRLAIDLDVETTIWDFVTVKGFTPDVDNLTATQVANLTANNTGAYLTLGGVGATGGGNRQCGGRFTDVQLTVDWLSARLAEAHAQLLLNASNRGSKIPYTDAGFAQVGAVAQGVLRTAIRAGHLVEAANDQGDLISPFVTLPTRASLSDAQVAARSYTYSCGGLLAGGVQRVVLNADLTDNLETLALLAST